MRSLRLAMVLGAGFGLSACATKTPNAAAATQASPKMPLTMRVMAGVAKVLPHKKPGPPKAQPASALGIVKLVNTDEHFVLIDSLAYNGEAPGTPLVCLSKGRQTATLHLSAQRNPPFLIGDIVQGSPSVGDYVYKP